MRNLLASFIVEPFRMIRNSYQLVSNILKKKRNSCICQFGKIFFFNYYLATLEAVSHDRMFDCHLLKCFDEESIQMSSPQTTKEKEN